MADTSTDGGESADATSYADIEIFAGAGGMTLGLETAGFHFTHVFEIDPHTCQTLEANRSIGTGLFRGEVWQQDVSKVDWHGFHVPIRLLAGGAPCQPFSLAGRHLADRDERNMFPEVLQAVRCLRPQAVLLENVQGLARPSFRPYLDYIVRQLEWPSVAPNRDEEWQDHNQRISQHEKATTDEPDYLVDWASLEAADFGVAQRRKRVFIVATKAGLSERFNFPEPTHRREALILAQANGDYWNDRSLPVPEPSAHGIDEGRFEEFSVADPWQTVRDQISDLPPPASCESRSDDNHWLIPSAKVYRGHSGSRLDWPSKTIKAGVHGVPGGENIVLLDDGTYRYFTLRETARLQGFPDDFVFCGARLHITRQIGNAVPVGLAEAIGHQLWSRVIKPNDESTHHNSKS